jgi:hypothetical protein
MAYVHTYELKCVKLSLNKNRPQARQRSLQLILCRYIHTYVHQCNKERSKMITSRHRFVTRETLGSRENIVQNTLNMIKRK